MCGRGKLQMDGENSKGGGSWFVLVIGGGAVVKQVMLICGWLPVNVREERYMVLRRVVPCG